MEVEVTEGTALRHTRAVVDLRALRSNLALLGGCMPQARLLPAVKADAYGHGAIAVARTCLSAGCAGVCVATLSEAASLRQSGFTGMILILEDLFDDEIPAAVALGVSLAVSSLAYAQLLSREAERRDRQVAIHFKIDTGMGRLGLDFRQALAVFAELASLPGLELEGVFSHFACADAAELGFSYQQMERADWFFRQLHALGLRPRYRHFANSAAMLRFGQLLKEDNLARPGIALYGLSPGPPVPLPPGLTPILSLESQLLKVAHYAQPWPIGYGGTWQAPAGSWVGIVPIGYADGYARALSNKATVLVRGRPIAVVGRVSMDMIALDLSPLFRAGEMVERGEQVVLIGQQTFQDAKGKVYQAVIRAEDLAQWCDTIPYEVVCRLSARVPRVYLG